VATKYQVTVVVVAVVDYVTGPAAGGEVPVTGRVSLIGSPMVSGRRDGDALPIPDEKALQLAVIGTLEMAAETCRKHLAPPDNTPAPTQATSNA
jgi:hypothetical protein